MRRRTKIVATLGPATNTKAKLRRLISAGMNVARINCSHGNWEDRRLWIQWIRELSPDFGPIGILADLQGPKFRLGALAGDNLILGKGQSTTIGPEGVLPLVQPEILAVMRPGDRLLLGDGDVELKLGKEENKTFNAKVLEGGTVKSKQGVTVVGRVFRSSCLTQKDIIDVEEACKAGVDFLALSYVHSAEDMLELRALADKYDKQVRLCAKVETRDAVENIEKIVQVSDVVMVARGDMGLQMDIEDVPIAQKRIIRAACEANTPVITATQMLESMMKNNRPTRAEATDVANAILDGTDAVMLSGETAAGEFPFESVKVMARIALKAEAYFDSKRWLEASDPKGSDETIAISYAVAQLADFLKPKAILTMTTSGHTARIISKFRPRVPILTATWSQRTHRQLSVVWGVNAIHLPVPSTTDEQIEMALDAFARQKRLKIGDNVIVSAGVPAGMPGNTNLIMLQQVRA